MHVKQSTAIMLCSAVLAADCANAADILYPIFLNSYSNSTIASRLPETVTARSVGTNEVSIAATISVTLKPTSIAPAHASGTIQATGRALELHLGHLDPGRYDLQYIKRSDGLSNPLGSLTIVDPTLGPDRQANDNRKEASAHPESVLIQSDVQMTLPFEIDTNDIARFVLMTPGGNAVLVGKVK